MRKLPQILIYSVTNYYFFFKDAVKALSETKIACPIYYIISGPGVNDGVVIERNTDSIHGFY